MQENTQQYSFLLHKKIHMAAAFHKNSFCSYTILWCNWSLFSLFSELSQLENKGSSQSDIVCSIQLFWQFLRWHIFKDTNHLNTINSFWEHFKTDFKIRSFWCPGDHEHSATWSFLPALQKDDKLFWSTLLP